MAANITKREMSRYCFLSGRNWYNHWRSKWSWQNSESESHQAYRSNDQCIRNKDESKGWTKIFLLLYEKLVLALDTGMSKEQWWSGSCLCARKNSRARQMREGERDILKMRAHTWEESAGDSENESLWGSHDQGFSSLRGLVTPHWHGSFISSPWAGFPLFLPCFVPPELSWCQMRDMGVIATLM